MEKNRLNRVSMTYIIITYGNCFNVTVDLIILQAEDSRLYTKTDATGSPG